MLALICYISRKYTRMTPFVELSTTSTKEEVVEAVSKVPFLVAKHIAQMLEVPTRMPRNSSIMMMEILETYDKDPEKLITAYHLAVSLREHRMEMLEDVGDVIKNVAIALVKAVIGGARFNNKADAGVFVKATLEAL